MKQIYLLSILLLSSLPLLAQEPKQSNRHFWHSMTTSASPEVIWAVWVNVPQWKEWDTGLQDASLTGAFAEGAKGSITSLQGRRSGFKLVEVREGLSYTMKTKLPLGALYIKRILEVDEKGTTFRHEVWFTGLTAGLFAKAFGADFRAMLPEVLQNVEQRALAL